jgi:iron complex transport system substrate-binding protein
VSLAPDLTELLFAAGAGSHVIGVIAGSDYPSSAKKIAIVGRYNQIDIERLVKLQPDLIIAWTAGGLGNRLKRLGIPIFFSEQHMLADIPATLVRLGCLAGTQVVANRAARHFSQEVKFLKQKYKTDKPIPVFYQIGYPPLLTVTAHSWITEVINLCGAYNIFANLTGTVAQVSPEAVIMRNPLAIISTGDIRWQQLWAEWPSIKAVQNHQLITIDADLLERAGPRLMIGARLVCEQLALVKHIS